MPDFELYGIIDKGLLCKRNLTELAGGFLKGRGSIVQLRAKDLTAKEMLRAALSLRELTKKFGASFIINDRVDIALACEADGVHLGQDDLPLKKAKGLMGLKIVGVSTHSLEQAMEAEKGGADYISVGPIFSTELKKGCLPVGLDLIHKVKAKVRIPVVAVGGINIENVSQVIGAGAANVAVCSAIMKARNCEEATRDLLEEIKRVKNR